MPSSDQQRASIRSTPAWRGWNRRAHYYLGLYFVFFLWLFALTGLLLNHGNWQVGPLRLQRTVTQAEQSFLLPATATALEQAQALLRQFSIEGEIEWLILPANAERLEFRVARPRAVFEIKADLVSRRATIQRSDTNAGGAFRLLHTFTGVRLADAKNDRDWLPTLLWAWSMDAVAAGLVLMVMSGVIMWWNLAEKRVPGLLCLATGTVACGWLVFGLRWMA